MPLTDTFNARMKDAMKRRDARELGLLRMIKTRFQLKLTEKGQSGILTDEMATAEIATYVKQQKKALPEFEKAGEKGKDKVSQILYEIDYLQEFLPKMMDEAQTEALMRESIAKMGLSQPNEIGRLMGMVMKQYKGQVDPGLAKKIATRLLG